MSLSAVLSAPPAPSGPAAHADEVDLETFLELLAPPVRPWMQRTARSLASDARRWLRDLPERAAGWGAGPGGAWRAW